MTQHARARRTDPSTSHAAARAVDPDLSLIQRRVLAFARDRGVQGFTDLDLEEAFMDHRSTFRTRRTELTHRRLIKDTGRRVKLKGDRCHRIVWAIA